MEEKTAQLRAKPNVISQYGSTVFWETPSRAQFLIGTGQFVLVNAGPTEAKPVGPSRTKPAGPGERKVYAETSNANEASARGQDITSGTILREAGPGDIAEKKSYGTAPAGLSTDIQKSTEPGTDAQSSVLPPVPHSPLTNADLSPKRKPGRPRKSES